MKVINKISLQTTGQISDSHTKSENRSILKSSKEASIKREHAKTQIDRKNTVNKGKINLNSEV